VCQLFQLSNEFIKCDDRKQVLKIPSLGIGSCSLLQDSWSFLLQHLVVTLM
jgi:hypothetical protein